ncbi:MAG: hypothetical protein ACLQVJ_14400 [Syntrophobacteraceae bacterium]
MVNDAALIGWKEIAAFFGVSVRKAKTWRIELDHYHIIFKLRIGRPPRIYTCAFPSDLRNYAALRSSKGEIL